MLTRTALVSTLLLIGCGSDPVSYSAPVGINLKAKSGDVKSGVVYDEKGITTESGNPYGAFIKEARLRLGGVDPGRVQLESLTLLLGANSKGVTKLEEVLSGTVDVLFEMDDTKNSVPVGQTSNPQGSGPVVVSTNFSSDPLSPLDRQKLLAGSFKVIIRGSAAPGFDALAAEADLQLTFAFLAFP